MNPEFSPKNDLAYIKSLMENSSRFMSLSGLSGISAGIIALIGGGISYFMSVKQFSSYEILSGMSSRMAGFPFLFIQSCIALAILLVALVSGVYFTVRRAKKKKLPLNDKVTRRLILSMALPLLTGAFFCFYLYRFSVLGMIPPCTLVFYGLALFSGGNFTHREIKYLGALEVLLGLIGFLFPAYGMWLWLSGFGLLHILYGIIMYQKYERLNTGEAHS